jgi:hypothetical protein
MLYVNRIRGSIVVVVIFGKYSTSSNSDSEASNEATAGQNHELELS